MKPGWQTTEFWFNLIMTLISTLCGATGGVDPKFCLVAGAVSNAGYAISRGIAKHGDAIGTTGGVQPAQKSEPVPPAQG